MKTPDRQMLLLIDILKTLGIIKFNTEFCEAVNLRKQNLVKIRKGTNYFTPDHILLAIEEYKVNANWIFGVSDKIFLHHHFDPRLAEIDVNELGHR